MSPGHLLREMGSQINTCYIMHVRAGVKANTSRVGCPNTMFQWGFDMFSCGITALGASNVTWSTKPERSQQPRRPARSRRGVRLHRAAAPRVCFHIYRPSCEIQTDLVCITRAASYSRTTHCAPVSGPDALYMSLIASLMERRGAEGERSEPWRSPGDVFCSRSRRQPAAARPPEVTLCGLHSKRGRKPEQRKKRGTGGMFRKATGAISNPATFTKGSY